MSARPTVERRQLGLTLRRYRENMGTSQLVAGRHVGYDDSRISRVEDGIATLSPEKLEQLLDLYGVDHSERETILALGVEARKRAARRAYVDLLPSSYQRFADLEAAASKVYWYEPSVIPGLLQCPAYIDAIMNESENIWWEPSEMAKDNRISFRLQRQQNTWHGSGIKELHFIMGESAIAQIAGSTEVMKEQLRHLLKTIYSRNDVIIQITPFKATGNPARDGGFGLLEFGSYTSRVGIAPVIYGSPTYYDEPEGISTLSRAFQRVSELSLSLDETRRFITLKLEEM